MGNPYVYQRLLARLVTAWCCLLAPAWAFAQAPQPPPVPEAAEPGRLHLVLFDAESNQPLAGVFVRGDSASATTNENGAAELALQAGSHTLALEVPEREGVAAHTVQLPDVPIAKAQTTQVIATIAADGTLASVDIEAPESALPSAAPAEGPEPAEPQEARAEGSIRGSVLSLEDHKPVSGARIFVRGSPLEAETDAEGKFSLVLPEGEYTLSVIHSAFSTQTLDAVQVRPTDTTELRVDLTPAAMALDDFIVSAPFIQGSVASLMDTRRESAAATDAIGAEDISRTPASDAAGAAQRVVGVTVVDGRYVYVRGLGERYTNARLNNAALPSPEPDKATVPLDLIPTQMISSLEISKTFTADMPADFAGGSVRIDTIAVPERLILAASMSTGWNSQSTFRRRLSYQGGSLDWLGIDDGTRGLSPNVPNELIQVGQPRGNTGDVYSLNDIDTLAPELNTTMATKRAATPANHGGSLLIGNGWSLGGERRLGLAASLNYSRKYVIRPEIQREFRRNVDGTRPWNDFEMEMGREQVSWSGFGTATYEFSKKHRLRFTGFRSQLADDQALLFNGFGANEDTDFTITRFQFVSRSLNYGQLRGEHAFPWLGDGSLDWNLALSTAERSEPDTRDAVYVFNDRLGEYILGNTFDTARHFFSDQGETARSGGLDWTQPFAAAGLDQKIKVGSAVSQKSRDFAARRFSFVHVPRVPRTAFSCGEVVDTGRCPTELFTDENVMGTLLRMQESTKSQDAYEANLDVYAAYLLFDTQITNWLRLIAGSRVERTHQRLTGFNQFTRETVENGSANLERTDLLPNLGLVFKASQSTLVRASVARTLARPQLRELAPFAFADYYGGRNVAGNPDLKLSRILNGDLRLEHFPNPRDVLAISIFAKDFIDPIEPIFKPTGSVNTLTYANSLGAFLYGVEVEARRNLGFLGSFFDPFSLNTNLTLAASEIRVEQTGVDASGEFFFLTNTERPMVNQAPYVVNVMLDYEGKSGTQLRVLYNLTGPRIVEVGTEQLDDAYLHRRHMVDVILVQRLWDNFQLKFSAQNILNAEYVVTLGKSLNRDLIVRSFREGVTLGLSLGYVN